MRHCLFRSLLVVAAVTVMLEARAESNRWWRVPSVIDAMRLSPAQCRQLDRIYDDTLPARRRLAEEMTALAGRVQRLNDSDASDEEVLPASEQLTHAQAERCLLQESLATKVEAILTPAQQGVFRSLVRRKAIGFE